jgi:leader peptidase (prepilin peptidase)/N-methyltransferase
MDGSVGVGAPTLEPVARRWEPLRVPHPRAVAVACTALIAVAALGLSPSHALIATLLLVPLVIVTATDIERRLIPNVVVLPATLVVLGAQAVLFPGALPSCVLGGLVAAALLFAPRLLNGDSVGMGDVKLALLLGAALGWGAVGALLVAFLLAFPFALSVVVRGGGAARHATFAFGPFLAAGALLILLAPAFS